MAKTPEGKVKERLKKYFKTLAPHIDAYWPVKTVMGNYELDCIGGYKGFAFAIELKAGSKIMTPKQTTIANRKIDAGTQVFLINDGECTWQDLYEWIAYIDSIESVYVRQ
jgi:hypothetical protein